VIEVASGAAVAWQFSAADPEARDRTALRVIAGSFFALAAYVGVESIRSVLGAETAGHSTVGIVLAAASAVLVMPVLSAAQRRAGRELGSASAVADSKQTLLCTYLSGVLRVGAEQPVRLVVGRTGRVAGHRRPRGEGGTRSQARRTLLLRSPTATAHSISVSSQRCRSHSGPSPPRRPITPAPTWHAETAAVVWAADSLLTGPPICNGRTGCGRSAPGSPASRGSVPVMGCAPAVVKVVRQAAT